MNAATATAEKPSTKAPSGARKSSTKAVKPKETTPIDPALSQYRDPRIEKWLDDHHATYTLVLLDLSSIDRETSRHNQARFKALDETVVIQYAESTERGDTFPPIVVYQAGDRYLVIDGNHRTAAFDLNDLPATLAYVVEDPSPAQVTTLTFEANTRHGLPTSQDERVQQAIYLIEMGSINQNQAAAMLSVPLGVLKHAYERYKADQRLSGLGLKRIERIPQTTRVRLGNLRSDVVLREVFQLTIDGDLRTEDVSALVKEINALRSEKEQLAVVTREREARSGAIKATAGGRLAIPQQVTTLLRVTSTLNRANPKGLTEALKNVPPEMRGDIIRACGSSIEVLMRVTQDLRRIPE